jgi:hypothetical protein
MTGFSAQVNQGTINRAWGQMYRDVLGEASHKKGMKPRKGVVKKKTKGPRPTTRVKKKKGKWVAPKLINIPFNPHTLAASILCEKLNLQITEQVIFRQALDHWNALSARMKDCWCKRAAASGAKCGCLDYFLRAQIAMFRATCTWDRTTCKAMIISFIICDLVLTFSPGGTVTSRDWKNPSTFLAEVGTSVTASVTGPFVPGRNFFIWCDGKETVIPLDTLPYTWTLEGDTIALAECIEE